MAMLVIWDFMGPLWRPCNELAHNCHRNCQQYEPTIKGPPVTTKPDGEAGGFCGDRRPEGHVFHTSRQAMIKTYYSTSIRKNVVQNCSYFTQMKSTTTAIDDSNRRRSKLGLGCSWETTAPLILIFKLLFLWLNIGRQFKGITQFHNCHSPKHTSKKYYLVINIFRKICTKIIT